jgi:aspartate carbamoyltransferase catalytic subunit
MHPLPINTEKPADDTTDAVIPEIAPECDNHPKAKFMQQSDGGLKTRQAITFDLLREDVAA